MSADRPLVVVEDDVVLRLLGVVIDPETPAERVAAFADYMRHDLPGFEPWLTQVRARLGAFYPARVIAVKSAEDLTRALPHADVLVVEALEVGEKEIAAAPGLRAVQQFGINPVNIDAAACARRGIPVLTIRRRTNIAVAEHTIAMMMALAKRLPRIDGVVTPERVAERGFEMASYDRRHVANANWGRVPGIRLLAGSTLGLLGLGEIGQEVAGMARGIGMRVLYNQRSRAPAELEETLGVRYAGRDELLAAADVLSVHVPFNDGTRDLVGAAELGRLRPGALILNTARAPIVNRQALIEALASGHLGGAGFDALYAEPTTEDDPLLGFDNVTLTPHLAGGTRMNGLQDMSDMLAGLAQAAGYLDAVG